MNDAPATVAVPWFSAVAEYMLDAWQRTVLTWDVLRERGNQALDHARSGKPPVLVFDYEPILDARTFPKPANYTLLRVKPTADQPPMDPTKRPLVVIDPRAGHGPGIGGFKIDSEVGIALQHGHPCYFVMFSPHPVPGQTIESVCAAEIAFLRKVNELHPNAAGQPFAIGNCQGGWALMMLAALAPRRSDRSCWRVRRCRTGRASRARTRCATWVGCWAAAGRRRCWPIWATASSTARTWSPTSSASTRRTRTGRSSTTCIRRWTRSASASCSSSAGGAATSS